MPIRIVKGLEIPLKGIPEQVIAEKKSVTSVALLGGDYIGLSPTMRVEEGERVKTGQPLFVDRKHKDVVFTSPGSGVVDRIHRGPRRALLSVTVRLEGEAKEAFASWTEEQLPGLRRDQVVDNLLASGLWTALRTRPYSRVPDPQTIPSSVFVTAIDSNPLAARPDLVIDAFPRDFVNGLTVVSHLTEGPVFLCRSPDAEIPAGDTSKVSVAEFSGPHPAGLVGTHIHFLDPVGAQKTAWHLNYQDVIAIGKLFTTGLLWTERIIAVGGPVVRRPRLIRTRLGASTDELVRDELHDTECRVISGPVLSGRRASGPEAYLGRFHSQISVIAEAQDSQGRGGHQAQDDRFTTYGPHAYNRPVERKFALSTALHGRPSAIIPLGGFERVMPLDILPTQLLRALSVGDTEMAKALGCLELDEEDLALCSFVCPGKQEYGPLLRAALHHIEKEG